MLEKTFLLILTIPTALIFAFLIFLIFKKEPEDLTYILNNKENEDRD